MTASIQGIYHGKRPVLEVRKGTVPFWKSPGWTTPSTSLAKATSIPFVGGGQYTQTSLVALPDGRLLVNEYNENFELDDNMTFQKLPLAKSFPKSQVDKKGKFLITQNPNSSTGILLVDNLNSEVSPNPISQYRRYTNIVDGDDDGFLLFGDVTFTGDIFSNPTKVTGAISGAIYGGSFYDGYFYVLTGDSGGTTSPSRLVLRKYTKDVVQESSIALPTSTSVNISKPTHAEGISTSTYDDAGNIFVAVKNPDNAIMKVTRSGETVWYRFNGTKFGSYTGLFSDRIGNVYAVRYGDSKSGNNGKIEITKLKNDMTVDWIEILPTTNTSADTSSTMQVSVSLDGVIYVANDTNIATTAHNIDIYQQIKR